MGGLGRGLDKLGVARPGTFGKVATLAGNFGKSRSLSGLFRDVDKLGVLAKAGTLGKVATLTRNFGKSRSLSGLFRDVDRLGVLAKSGTLGKLATVAGNFGKSRSLSGLLRDVDKLGVLAKSGTLGKLAALAGNFGKSRSIGEFVNNAAPLLKTTARMAAPIVSASIGGPFGGLAAKMLGQLLREGEAELYELEQGLESGFELEAESYEALGETGLEIINHELAYHEALAEMIAEAAEQEQHEAEAETLAGAAALTVISPADRAALRRVLPQLVRGTAILTRILRARPGTRPAVRAVPTITRRTVSALKRQAAEGIPITRRTAGRAAAREVRRVLGSPIATAAAVANNVRATQLLRTA
jgi:hypothetical protein